jgi:hypothetical protein
LGCCVRLPSACASTCLLLCFPFCLPSSLSLSLYSTLLSLRYGCVCLLEACLPFLFPLVSGRMSWIVSLCCSNVFLRCPRPLCHESCNTLSSWVFPLLLCSHLIGLPVRRWRPGLQMSPSTSFLCFQGLVLALRWQDAFLVLCGPPFFSQDMSVPLVSGCVWVSGCPFSHTSFDVQVWLYVNLSPTVAAGVWVFRFTHVCSSVSISVLVLVCVYVYRLNRRKTSIVLVVIWTFLQGDSISLGLCPTKLPVKWDIQLGQLDVLA